MKKEKGFTILFAVLVASLVLALGMGIISLTQKELQLSGAERDSQVAFYASDSGAECAFYWDLKGENFATSSQIALYGTPDDIKCNNQRLYPGSFGESVIDSDIKSATTKFNILMEKDNPRGPCVDVTVTKSQHSTALPDQIDTVINARGYNTCDQNSPRRLERGYSIQY